MESSFDLSTAEMDNTVDKLWKIGALHHRPAVSGRCPRVKHGSRPGVIRDSLRTTHHSVDLRGGALTVRRMRWLL